MPTFRYTLSVHASYLPAYEDGTECSETSAYKIETPGNYPKGNTLYSEHGESLKSRNYYLRYICLSVRMDQHGWLSLDGFSQNLIFDYCSKIRRENSTGIKNLTRISERT